MRRPDPRAVALLLTAVLVPAGAVPSLAQDGGGAPADEPKAPTDKAAKPPEKPAEPKDKAAAPADKPAGPAGKPAAPADKPAPSSAAPPSGFVGGGTSAADSELAAAFRDVIRNAPLSVPRLNFLHATLEVPPMDTAATLPRGAFYMHLRSTHARSDHKATVAGVRNDFDATFHEWANLEGVWAPREDLEVAARAVFAGWDQGQDRFDVFDENGVPVVEDEADIAAGGSGRHTNVSVLGVRTKHRAIRSDEDGWDLSIAPSLKIPFGRNRDLTHAGTYDAALTLLATYPDTWGSLHANVGVTYPFGDTNLFERDADVDLEPFLHGGIGAVVPVDSVWSVAAQVEANTSAFEDVEFLDEHPIAALVGVRRTTDRLVLELALGTAVERDSAAQFVVHLGIGFRF